MFHTDFKGRPGKTGNIWQSQLISLQAVSERAMHEAVKMKW
jgi:hypothetical protein